MVIVDNRAHGLKPCTSTLASSVAVSPPDPTRLGSFLDLGIDATGRSHVDPLERGAPG